VFLFWIVFFAFILLSFLLPTIILMQEPKMAGLGGGLGGGSEDFGPRGPRGTAGGLHKLTIYFGIAWGLCAFLLAALPRV
jgi:preprotein translocase subunit SecG